MPSSSIVIKVKFKKTLRRLIASIEDGKLALDVVMLREKICGFFSFDSGVEFTLTYLDEDDDVVTLAADDDLLDILQQSLDPLWITVEVNTTKTGVTSQTSSSLKSPQVPSLFSSSWNSAVSGNVQSQLQSQFQTLNLNSETSTVKDSKVPVNNPEVGSLNLKKKEKQGVKFKDVQQPSKDVDLNFPYFQTPINVVGGSTGRKKNAADGVEKKVVLGSEKKKEFQQMMTQMAFKFSKATNDDSGSSSDLLKATNQSSFVMPPKNPFVTPIYKDYLQITTHSKVHSGVRCNVCGVNPISGTWFKSKVKENYNLCSICFDETGTLSLFSRPRDPFPHVPLPILSQALKNPKCDVFGSKLNSGFLLDVNVPDGTIMAPLTKFTKIWRMWNNGPLVWPQGTQLQWVSGDRLGSSDSVNVEIPLFGLPVDKELDFAVDFIAPELPGSYVSYWRMSSPSGQKFGQQVWVMIKVDDAIMKDLGKASINLNLPLIFPEVVNQDADVTSGISELVNQDSDVTFVDSKPNDQDDDNDDDDDVSSTIATFSPAAVAAMSSLFDSTKVQTALNSLPEGLDTGSISYPTVDSVSCAPSSSMVPAVSQVISDDQVQMLLEDLEQMGFEQVNLNKEILRRNNYDLEKSIDDLCGVSEWDPMLGQLEEMGFADEEANRELLKKNNGSISRVVLDLINGKRD